MKDEYIIINRTALEKRLKELKYQRQVEPDNHTQSYLNGKIKQLDEILSQSTPLIHIIENAFDAGQKYGEDNACNAEIDLHNNKQDYISNLKLDI